MAVAVQQGEAQGERRAGHVAATHVQQPGDGVGGSNQRHVSAFRRDDLADAGALGVACLARELYRMRQHGRQRRRWPAMPHGVDGIGLHCDEGAAGTLAGAREAVVAVDGLQPGIESQAAALGQVLGDPGFRRFFRDLMGHEGRDIDLAADGEGVAAVDEDRRAVGQHDGEAGRAAEAGEPAQALRATGHVLALMFVGARHHEAIDAATRQFSAQ